MLRMRCDCFSRGRFQHNEWEQSFADRFFFVAIDGFRSQRCFRPTGVCERFELRAKFDCPMEWKSASDFLYKRIPAYCCGSCPRMWRLSWLRERFCDESHTPGAGVSSNVTFTITAQ